MNRCKDCGGYIDAGEAAADCDACSDKARMHGDKRICDALRELEVNQVELRLQNQELIRSRRALEESQTRYEALYRQFSDIFNFAPIGYVISDAKRKVIEVNITLAAMLGCPRGDLIGRSMSRLIHRDDQDLFHRHLAQAMETGRRTVDELRMVGVKGEDVTVQFQSIASESGKGPTRQVRTAVIDIRDRIQRDKNRTFSHRCLEIAMRYQEIQPLLTVYVREIKRFTGCDAVGIRIRDAEGNIPYQAYEGFSDWFYLSESPLSLHDDQCMCIDVIKGKKDAGLPFFSASGSFFINGTTRFLATVPEDQKGATRNVCNREGFESVALVPVPIPEGVLGLIHVADTREGRVPLAMVEALEVVAVYLGAALNRIQLEQELKASGAEMRFLSSRLLTVQEEEQARISMELHDHVGQNLSVLKLRIREIMKRTKEPELATERCASAMGFIDQIIADIRRLSRGLSPELMETLGLDAAIDYLIREFSELTQITVDRCLISLNGIFDRRTETVIYRIIQENLNNIYKHARASQVRIAASRSGDRVCLTIADDGRGFSRSSQPDQDENQKNKGLGLPSMKLRAAMIGANLLIKSSEGKGTEIILDLPTRDRR